MSEIVVRAATPDDAPRLAATSQRAYPDPSIGLAARIERVLNGPYPLETVYVAERDGQHVGQARTLDFAGWFGGVETRVGGLAGVAVTPEARRTGVAAALVRHHAGLLRDTGTPWAMLYPFAASFYAAHGWAPAARRLRWRFAPRALPLFEERSRVRRLDPERESDAMLAAFHHHCAAVSGSLSGNERASRWEWQRQRDKGFAVAVDDGAELAGYLLYSIDAPTPRPQTLVVGEWLARDAAAERALFGFLAAQGDQFEAVLLDTPIEHPLATLLDNHLPEREDGAMPLEHQPLATLYSGAMARVIDLEGALAGRGYPGGPGVVAVEIVADELIPANQRVVTVVVEGGAVRTSPGHMAGAPLVQGPVGPISAVLSGGARLLDAVRLGLCRATGDRVAADRLLALPVPYPLVVF